MFSIRFYRAFLLLAFILVNAAGAASICDENPSDPACNANSKEFQPDYEYLYYRSGDGTSNKTKENGNKTGDGEVYPFFGNIHVVLNFRDFHWSQDFILSFNGSVGNQVGDKIDAEMSSGYTNETIKFSLEYLSLDEKGTVFRFIPSNNTTSDFRKMAFASGEESPKEGDHPPEIAMVCLKIPKDEGKE